MLYLWWLLRELNTELPYNPAILLLGICPRKMKISVPRKTSRKMFTEHHSLAQSGNNPNVNQLMGGSIKIWYVYTLEYYSVIRRTESSNTDKLWKHDAEWKTPDTSPHTVRTPFTRNVQNGWRRRDRKQGCGCQGPGLGEVRERDW